MELLVDISGDTDKKSYRSKKVYGKKFGFNFQKFPSYFFLCFDFDFFWVMLKEWKFLFLIFWISF
jgi:hypothetical protein